MTVIKQFAAGFLLLVSFVDFAAAASLWEHNGSIVSLDADGSTRKFSYVTPRAGLDVSAGTLLFNGAKSGDTYSGTAYQFSKKCGAISYSVSGSVSPDQRVVTMTGEAPVRDGSCKVVSTRTETLIFTYQRTDPATSFPDSASLGAQQPASPTAELPHPPVWTGVLPQPGPTCPNTDDKFRTAKYIYICKHAEIGSIRNTRPFSPQPFEDNNDPDWAFLKQFWRTGKQFYFGVDACGAGDTDYAARWDAEMNAGSASKQTATAWDNLLKSGKFRPYLEFSRESESEQCRPIRGATASPQVSDSSQDAERQRQQEIERQRRQEIAEAEARRREAEEVARHTLLVKVRSLDQYIVHLEFYSQARNNAWPGGDQIYPLKDSQFHEFRLNCTPGEKICYGAGRSGNYKRYWGVGIGDKYGCTGCCMTCGSAYSYTLNGGDDDSGASGGVSESDLSDFIGALSGLAGAVGGGGGGGGYHPSPSYRRAPTNRNSDITGTH